MALRSFWPLDVLTNNAGGFIKFVKSRFGFILASAVAAALAGALAGCATIDRTDPADPSPPLPLQPAAVETVFPTPRALQPQVDFWQRVYSEWQLGQVVLHDDRHLQLVYAVLTLPAPINDAYRRDQRAYVRARRQMLAAELAALERKYTAGLSTALSARERRLLALIDTHAGVWALRGAAERLRSQRGLRERFARGLALSGRYLPRFKAIFRNAGLPQDLAYLPHVESSFQSRARSSAGATGMWQFTRGAARRFMRFDRVLDERLDPIASARGAARYLSHAYDLLETWPLALTSYNHGINGMLAARRRFGTDFVRIVHAYDHPSFGFASRNFYAEFLAARAIASHPQRFFPDGIDYHAPLAQDSIVLAAATPVSALSAAFDLSIAALQALNPAWRRAAIRGRLPLPAGTEVWLPAGTLARQPSRTSDVKIALRTPHADAEIDVSALPE